jgi:hypothetical protein
MNAMIKKRTPQTPRERALAAVLIVGSVAIVSAAEVDLHRRPPELVRGDKRVWRVVCLDALGGLAYLFFGRLRDR